VVGAYYRLPDRGEPTDEALFLQLQEALCSQALVLLGDFNNLDTSAGKVAWQAAGNLGDSWSAWRMTSEVR